MTQNQYNCLYQFNEAGLEQFIHVMNLKEDDSTIDPISPKYTSPVSRTGKFEVVNFENTKEMSKAILDSFGDTFKIDILYQTGVWAWLSFVLRDQICGFDKNGIRKSIAKSRWYPRGISNWSDYSRHAVRTPVSLYHDFGDDVDHILCSKLDTHGDIREQIIGRMSLIQRVIQQAAKRLYYDGKGKVKGGVSGKLGGSVSRFGKVTRQLEITYELMDLDVEGLLRLLPPEFDKYK